MTKIPISFEYQGIHYTGTLDNINGAGKSDVYHLMVNSYYWGRLRKAQGKWVFDATPKDPDLADYADYFGHEVDTYPVTNQ